MRLRLYEELFVILLALLVIYFMCLRELHEIRISKQPPAKVTSLKQCLRCNQMLRSRESPARDRWPQSVQSYAEICEERLVYDLQLRPKLAPLARSNDDVLYELVRELARGMSYEMPVDNSSLFYDFIRMYEAYHMGGGFSDDFDLYPQLISIGEVVENITQGGSLNQTPMNDPNRIVFRWPTLACATDSHGTLDLLIIVKNIASNAKGRSLLRNYYAEAAKTVPKVRFRVVFSVGLPFSETGNYFRFKYLNSALKGRAGRVVNRNKLEGHFLTKQLFQEADAYGDILVGNYYDSYYNLTAKMITSFRWASAFCHERVSNFAFTDDDYVLQLQNVWHRYQSMTQFERDNDIGSFVYPHSQVFRASHNPFENRWAVDVKEYPFECYPPYPYGITFFVGPKVLDTLAIGSAYVQDNRVDDVFIGLTLFKASMRITNLPGISEIYSDETKSRFLLAGKLR